MHERISQNAARNDREHHLLLMRSGDEFMQKRGSCMSTAHLSEKSVFAEGMACNSKPSTSIFKKHIGRFSSLLMKSEMGYAGVFSLPPPLFPEGNQIGRHGMFVTCVGVCLVRDCR